MMAFNLQISKIYIVLKTRNNKNCNHVSAYGRGNSLELSRLIDDNFGPCLEKLGTT
jgi:hypothetical protein